MAIDFAGLFTKLGRIGRAYYVLAGGQAGLPTVYSSLFAAYADHKFIGVIESAADAYVRRAGAAAVMGPLVVLARQTLLDAVAADVPSRGTALPAALAELVRQMKAAGESVAACAVAATPTALPGNVGNGALVVSAKRGDGLIQQNAVAETAQLVCVRDAYSGTAPGGQEAFQFAGADPGTAGVWDYDWPKGSGGAAGLTAISPAVNASGTNNRLTNSDFENWTGSAPDGWGLETGGVWGTDAVRDTTAGRPFTGGSCVQVPAAKTPTVYQEFGDAAAGTAAGLDPLLSYPVNLWLRRVSAALTAGTLVAELTDDSGAVVSDAQGTPNSFVVNLSGLTTAYAAYTGVFRLPAVPPATLRLRLRVGVAPDQGFLIDAVAMGGLSRPANNSPGYAVFAGSTGWAGGDGWNVAVTNDRAGSLYGATFQTLFDRLFGTAGMNLILPYSGTPTRADTLITAP